MLVLGHEHTQTEPDAARAIAVHTTGCTIMLDIEFTEAADRLADPLGRTGGQGVKPTPTGKLNVTRIPQGWMRFLERANLNRESLEAPELALVVQGVGGHAREDELKSFLRALARQIRIESPQLVLARRNPTSHAQLKPATGQVIQHRDLLE